MKKVIRVTLFAIISVFLIGCATKKKKKDDGLNSLERAYENTTARFNGYFNANELVKGAIVTLDDQYQDNFNKILPVYKYSEAPKPKEVAGELDKAIEKVSIVVNLHRESDWTDDCYLLLGKSEYLKRDFESSEETLEYLLEEFNAKKLAERAEKGKKKKKKKKKKRSKKTTKKKSPKKKKTKKKKRGKSRWVKKKKEEPKPSFDDPDPKEEVVAVVPKKKVEPKESPKSKTEGEKAKTFLMHSPAYLEGMLWLAKSYIERDEYDEAEYTLSKLEKDINLSKDVRREIGPVRAFMYIRQKEYDRAIAPLELAIDQANKKKKKARYAFILAQIHQEAGRSEKAIANFKRVLKYGSEYDMEFRSRLNIAQGNWRTGSGGSDDVVRTLNRMLKDEKNTEYLDQIYFVLSEIALDNNDKPEAIANLKKSLAASTANTSQKTESYLLLAQLYFDAEDFVASKLYYDSTLQVMGKADERYNEALNYKNNLVGIARAIQTIQHQDSLLGIAALDMREKRAIAAEIKKKEDERKAAMAAAKAKPKNTLRTTMPSSRQGRSSRGGTSVEPSNFFAYNQRALKKGKRDFEKKWGGRVFENDWRRSNKQTLTDITGEEVEAEEGGYALTDDEVNKILKDIPSTAEDKAKALTKIEDALFDLGRLYREKLENDEKSIETLDQLLSRFPSTKHELEAWYYLYLAHTNLDHRTDSKKYYDLITGKYAESTYARVLTDPDFLKNSKDAETKLASYYDQTYTKFENGEVKTAYDRVLKSNDLFGKTNKLQAKFALLGALCIGNLQGKDAYITSLKEIVAKYPDTEEQKRAKEILRVLGVQTGTVTLIDEESSSKAVFKLDDNAQHYIIAVVQPTDVALNEMKASAVDYNKQFHKLDRLSVFNIYLNADTNKPVIVVRKFKSKAKAMLYYEGVQSNDSFLPEGVGFELFAISRDNYRLILKASTINSYKTFFEENYL